MIPGPDAPPFGLGLPKPHSALSRLTARAVTLAQPFVTGKFRKRLNEIRALYGLPPIHTTALAHLATVPLYIMPATPEFDYDRHDLPPSVKYVGPYLWNKPANIVSPDWLQTATRGPGFTPPKAPSTWVSRWCFELPRRASPD